MAVEEAGAAVAGKRKLFPCSGKEETHGGKRRSHEVDWTRLPDDILFCIFRAIVLSGSPASGFAAVCRPWRALAAASRKALASAMPPLLLRPAWGEAAMCPVWPVAGGRRWHPGRTRPCFRTASPGAAELPHASCGGLLPPLPPRFLRTRSVCQSRGYLITVDRSTRRAVLTNPLSGQELRPFPPLRKPSFPDIVGFRMIGAVLGDPASPAGGCRIVLNCEDGFFRTCISGATAWDTTPWNSWQPSDRPVQLTVVRGRVYALLSSGDLLLFDFMFSFRCLIMTIQKEPDPFRLTHKIGPYLVEHDGKVFTVHCTFVPGPSSRGTVKFRVCQLVKRQWVEQESLDGMALFVDAKGSAMFRARPGQWGGKENHVYASGWLWDGWKVFPFGDSIRSEDIPVDNLVEGRWPAPHWMLPCSCY